MPSRNSFVHCFSKMCQSYPQLFLFAQEIMSLAVSYAADWLQPCISNQWAIYYVSHRVITKKWTMLIFRIFYGVKKVILTLLVPTGGIIRPAPKENLCHIFIGRNFFFNLWWLFKFKPLTNPSEVRFFLL